MSRACVNHLARVEIEARARRRHKLTVKLSRERGVEIRENARGIGIGKIGGGQTELREVVRGEIDAAEIGIFFYVANNVG